MSEDRQWMEPEPVSSDPYALMSTLSHHVWVAVAVHTSQVSRRSTVSKIIFPLASLGISSSPGWNTERRGERIF